jgi:hypothetical protein
VLAVVSSSSSGKTNYVTRADFCVWFMMSVGNKITGTIPFT